MRLVVLTSRIPYPLEKGDKLRVFNQIKHLSEKHEICLICLNDRKSKIDLSPLTALVSELHVIQLSKWKIPFRLFFALFQTVPFQVSYFFERKKKNQIERIIQNFQPKIIYCQLIRAAEYVKDLLQFEKTLDYMDAFSAAAERRTISEKRLRKLFWKSETERLKNYERIIYDYFNHHCIISEQDRNLIALPSNKKIHIVPNGVDTSFFFNIKQTKKYEILFAGNMNYPPNIAAALFLVKEVLPLLLAEFPTIKLLIAGANPSHEVAELASKNVHISGWMNDIRDAYNDSLVFVAPMFLGAGMQNKILEAMSSELPVITTSLAANAFSENEKARIVQANSGIQFAQTIQFYLLNEAAQKADGELNRTYVEEKFSWKISNKNLELCLLNRF